MRNPDYWRRYRRRVTRAPEDAFVKMDSSVGLSAGLYRIRKSGVLSQESGDLWIIEVVCTGADDSRKMDVSREDLIDSL